VRNERAFQCEYRLRRADGDYLWINDHAIVLTDEMGQPTNVVGAMHDVTHQREAEKVQRDAEELHRVLFRLSSPTMHVDANGHYSMPTLPLWHSLSERAKRCSRTRSRTIFRRR